MINSLMPSLFYEMPSKILQSHKEKSCLDNFISRMKLKKKITSEKTAELFNILTGLWPNNVENSKIHVLRPKYGEMTENNRVIDLI